MYIRKTILLLFCLLYLSAQSQVCNGSLGDAVVKVDFGSGPGIGAPLPPSVISYNYVAQDCPNDGSYTIINKTNGCFSGTWYVYNEDHTPGDINGYMLIVNSSLQPNDFYVDTVRGLCPNTKYEFSAWITNLIIQNTCNNAPTPPNVRFTIETVSGIVLGSYNTGDIPAKTGPEWEKYGLFFTTNNTDPSVVIRMRNNAPGGCGNDLALDDISFRPCGPLVVSTLIGSTSNNMLYCEGASQNVSIVANVGVGYNNPSYQWQRSVDNGLSWTDIIGANNTNYNTIVSSVGKYLYRLAVAEGTNISNSSCRVLSNNIVIEIKANPVAIATVNSPVCAGSLAQFTANAGNSFQWMGPNGFSSSIQNPMLTTTLNSNGDYFLEITDQFGCKGKDTVMLQINAKPLLQVTSSKDTVCAGSTINLLATGGSSYDWSPSTYLSATTGSQLSASIQNSITYQVITASTNGCKDTAQISIIAHPLPTVSAGLDKTITAGAPVNLNGQTNDPGNIILWTPADFLNSTTVLEPTANPLQDIDYTITASSTFGCAVATDQVSITVFKGLFIPNSFTPNGDGNNDTWRIPALAAFPNAQGFVYNRYGQMVFQLKNNQLGWDGIFKGQPATAGTYIYLIDLKNGTPLVKGSLILIR